MIIYSDHAKERMGQRGITELEIEHILKYAKYIIKTKNKRKIAMGEVDGKPIKVIFLEKENYKRVITIR